MRKVDAGSENLSCRVQKKPKADAENENLSYSVRKSPKVDAGSAVDGRLNQETYIKKNIATPTILRMTPRISLALTFCL